MLLVKLAMKSRHESLEGLERTLSIRLLPTKGSSLAALIRISSLLVLITLKSICLNSKSLKRRMPQHPKPIFRKELFINLMKSLFETPVAVRKDFVG